MRVSNVTVRRRLIFVLLVGLAAFLIIMLRLGYVQFALGDWLTGQAQDSWSRDVPFEAKRGEITDRNDVVLATNVSAPSILVVPRQVKDPTEAAEKLANVLQMDRQKAYELITKKESIVRLNPEGRKISKDKANEVRKLRLPGVYIAEDSKRHYPFGSYLSHVLGFAGIDNQGLTGLELYYDEQLKGEKGHVSFFSDAKGQRLPNLADEYTAPINGLNLRLTIDSRVQTIIERELDIAEATYSPDGAIAIAMNPNTGEILGMSSRPHYNPENFREVPPEVYNQNKPIWMQYEPGSTFKIITLAAALEENEVDLTNDRFHDPGFIEVAGHRLRCWKKGGHGSQTFLEVVENSCNPGFVVLGERLGKDRLFDYIEAFGFGQKTGIDLQGEAKGIIFNRDRIGPLEQATTAFGQGVSVTPIQQVAAVSAAVNGGYLYEPYVAKDWVDPYTGEVVESSAPKMKRQIISEETSKEVRYALESVVARGTGQGAFVDGYRVGGKTGTAQKAKDGRYLENNHIVSFIGFAPADDPQIVVYVAIDNPKDTVQFGGVVAAPIVGKIIGDSLQALGIEKRENQIEKERKWNDEPLVEVPDLVGRTKRDLHESYYELKIDADGKGDVVVAQAPEPGTKVAVGSTIRLYMDDDTEPTD
ncbi:stage V sporulation protein D [Halalkalibacterium halodurans]|uniref:stage V sporulation protein D n=1 Tax=Halalkalibacterium halodurans TaxID=86665 RepID=UPI002E248E86|nr:stage V sporulation protein D [Halalkalibacterium halodurans]MED4079716.1 stage V sporulation protein D [Halalkalibacterium halodurans]MED4086342.1 stage V sporulation protein D [Halalkalibacterium halodurans]MED4103313.1 stage V sporulation protein D [Halalkalibacterium halodurans]MED4107990.1 stage V sporulation protein D [Halalkalibacterium halodurans]MED4148293.1 stage V sporulation protein D [Halalkalibacterium halodurans]